MSDTALILVDIQNDYFCDGLWPVAKMEDAAANAARVLAHARATGLPVFHVRHDMPSDTAPFFRPGTAGAEINAAVAPEGAEPVIRKRRPNSFLGTDLKDRLDAAGASNVIVCGAMSQMCIDATARAAADLGYKVTVVQDACGAKELSFNGIDIPAETVHATIMAALSGTYAKVVSTDTVLGAA